MYRLKKRHRDKRTDRYLAIAIEATTNEWRVLKKQIHTKTGMRLTLDSLNQLIPKYYFRNEFIALEEKNLVIKDVVDAIMRLFFVNE